MGHWKNRCIQTPQRILMDLCVKQAPVLSKWYWIIPWPLAYNRLELDCIRKIIYFWYTFGWKWSFRDCLGSWNSCSYDVIGRADRFGFQNFCSPAIQIYWACAWRDVMLNISFWQNGCLSNFAILYDLCIDSAYAGKSTCTTAFAETIWCFVYTI